MISHLLCVEYTLSTHAGQFLPFVVCVCVCVCVCVVLGFAQGFILTGQALYYLKHILGPFLKKKFETGHICGPQ
jgi:hypothetical protein